MPEGEDKYARFARLGFDDFRALAADDTLTPNEKIGFPESYRAGKEAPILADLIAKIPALAQTNKRVLDIGPGCGDLARLFIDHSVRQEHELVLIDSEEMLLRLPDLPKVKKVAAYYPQCPEIFEEYAGRVDAIVVYSVFQYVFAEGNAWNFLDRSLSLLAPGGRLLIGDIPNITKRKRFFASDTGVRFHQAFTQSNEVPRMDFNVLEPGNIDDSVVLAVVARARMAGFDAYVVPQAEDLPMANRREDILIVRP
ncbi:bifunctional 2-polyprenyl-6-hydroxyphenol methylase/3-demethylubiquinol 3-O-methyltransferase UbiG [Paraburkholderia terrae]|uniref:class I SAM-dependent methyltransferase n=1 Tax=Paraburkholderia terrae TaxID=311230 RepID=UPI001EE1A172|nr:methyltransferase [Paraburkholderia terrae]GJH02905.1 SAM-dependent methyltransferase [Paraburkholderia terrae]